jgi:hypothetical protein
VHVGGCAGVHLKNDLHVIILSVLKPFFIRNLFLPTKCRRLCIVLDICLYVCIGIEPVL